MLYGSRAKGDFHDGSDIDLALIGNELQAISLYRIDEELEDLLLPYTFDLSLLREIGNPKLQEHIHRVGVNFYHRKVGCVGYARNLDRTSLNNR